MNSTKESFGPHVNKVRQERKHRHAPKLTCSIDADTWKSLLDRLSDYDNERAQRRLRYQRTLNTTDWLIAEQAYVEWTQKPHSLANFCLWLSGDGKCPAAEDDYDLYYRADKYHSNSRVRQDNTVVCLPIYPIN